MNFNCFDYVTVGVCIIDEAFTILWWNKRLEEWTGKKRDEIIGEKLDTLFPHFKEEKYRQRITPLFRGGAPVIFSYQLHRDLFNARTVTGDNSVQKATVSAYPGENGTYYAVFSIEDITDLSHRIEGYRKMRDDARKASAEKEMMFREMNHRIKNNLHMVSALIDLQTSKKNKKKNFDNLKNQINAVKIVHEKLYKSDALNGINAAVYLREIVEAAIPYSLKDAVNVLIDVPELFFEPRVLLPIGLICNEIATNAVKYGFRGDKHPLEFRLSLNPSLHPEKEKNYYTLILSNNGNPFPEDSPFENTETLGLRLVSSLVQQLRGTIELRRSPSPEFTIRFSIL